MHVLTPYNFWQFAQKNYNNPFATSVDDLNEDIRRISYVKRHILRYLKTGKIKERLIINQIIIFANVFGIVAAVRMLFLKCEEVLFPVLKTFLVFLNYVPQDGLISELNFSIHSIPLDQNIVSILRNYK